MILKSLKPLVQMSFYILLWMTWLRIVLFLYNIYPEHGIPSDLAASLFAGFRFDLLVLGFAWIPIWVLYWFFHFLGRVSQVSGLFKAYFFLIVLGTTLLTIVDFYWFNARTVRMTFETLSPDGFWAVADQATNWRLWSAIPLIVLPGFVLGLLSLWKMNIADYSEKPMKVLLNFIFSLLIVASAARGTWTAHHLELADAQVSSFRALNELALNPWWNLDKF